jgi:hypothetical protein
MSLTLAIWFTSKRPDRITKSKRNDFAPYSFNNTLPRIGVEFKGRIGAEFKGRVDIVLFTSPKK